MKELILFNTDKKALIDDEDYERLCVYRWRLNTSVDTITIRRESGNPGGKRKITSLACQIMNRFDVIFDHIDLNSFNNQKSNLREATHGQNMANRTKFKNKTSQYKGVSWRIRTRKWISQIRYQGKDIYLGSFDDEKEAALAWNKAAVELHKEFAVINNV